MKYNWDVQCRDSYFKPSWVYVTFQRYLTDNLYVFYKVASLYDLTRMILYDICDGFGAGLRCGPSHEILRIYTLLKYVRFFTNLTNSYKLAQIHTNAPPCQTCTNCHAIGLDFLLSDECNQSYIKTNVPALPSFIMEVNGGRDFEDQKSASIHHKKCSTQLRGLIKAFWRESMC